MDLTISKWIYNTFGKNEFFANFWKVITMLGSEWVIIGVVLLLLAFKKTRKIGIYMLIACGGAWIFNSIILKPIIGRSRPFVESPELAGICNLAGLELPDEFSMPSGHSVISMAVAMSVFMFSKKWGGIAFIYPFMIGLSRICLCVHYVTDVIVGWLVGAGVAIAVFYVLNLIIKYYITKKEKSNGKDSSSVSEQA